MRKFSLNIPDDMAKAKQYNFAIKLEIKGHIDPHFCRVLEVKDGYVTVEYSDHIDTLNLNDLTDVIKGW